LFPIGTYSGWRQRKLDFVRPLNKVFRVAPHNPSVQCFCKIGSGVNAPMVLFI
jgi:hypothetical protein